MTPNEQTAVETLKRIAKHRGESAFDTRVIKKIANEALDLLEASPTVLVSRWIPVTESLPEGGLVLVWDSETEKQMVRQSPNDVFVNWPDSWTHWQPLPEAPQ